MRVLNNITKRDFLLMLIYINLKNNRELLALVTNDFRKTGKCNLAVAKDGYGTFMYSWLLSKHDPNFEAYQQGYL